MNQDFLQTENLNKLQQFYQESNNSICFVEGESGFFKSILVKNSVLNVPNEYLTLSIKCFESTTLDDIFLNIFEEIKKQAQLNKLSFKKIETNSFALRINNYLKQLSTNTIIIIDSLQNIFSKTNTKEKEEIIRFIAHLNSMNKFKLVLISTSFPDYIIDKINVKDNQITRIKIEALTNEQIETFLKNENIEVEHSALNKFQELTHGNNLCINICSTIMSTLKTNLSTFIQDYENKYSTKSLKFEEYIIQKLLTFVPEKQLESLEILSCYNGGLPESFLIQNNFFTKEQLAYLIEKNILSQEYSLTFIKREIKKYIQKNITYLEKNKIHTYWKEFYTSQLPLKPNERTAKLSRNTMRAQIEYHTAQINILQNDIQPKQNMSLLSYLNSNLTDWNFSNKDTENKQKEKSRPVPPENNKNRYSIPKNLEKYELTKDELALLSTKVELNTFKQTSFNLSRTTEQLEEKQQEVKTLEEILSSVNELTKIHDFETATILLQKALELKTDKSFSELHPQILAELAYCYKKINKTTEAIDFYNQLSDLYLDKKNIDKSNETKLQIAKIHKETYKFNHAKIIYEKFTNKKVAANDKVLLIAYAELAEIEDDAANTEKAIELYKKAFNIATTIDNTDEIEDLLSKAYFKYALIADDMHKTETAMDYYQKCINISKHPTVFLSAAYTNLAEIMVETDNLKLAIEYYKKGLKNDINLTNHEGIYYICQKLAKIDNNNLDWQIKALSAAKRTKDNAYITEAYIELGKCYEQTNNFEKALKSYLNADKHCDYSINNIESPKEFIEKTKKQLPKQTIDKLYREMAKHE